jgi:LPXTG-site transpeptidase (sortase) family protein
MVSIKGLRGNQFAALISLFIALSIYSFYRVSDYFQNARFFSPASQNISPILPSDSPRTRQAPTSVYIPKINKKHAIQAAIVKDNAWQVFDKSVAWLSTSAVPGEGNVILYAHNWKSLWGDLYKLEPGDVIEVEQNTKRYKYSVVESRAVSKSDIDAVLSEENRLTLYTCEGTFDEKRRVVYALPADRYSHDY